MKLFKTFLCVLLSHLATAQVGINTTVPNPSSILDIESTDAGLLIPRVSLANVNVTQLNGVDTAATGLLIYNTNASVINGTGEGFYYFNGTVWQPIDTNTTDADFYEISTTNAPNDIDDPVFRTGDVRIGSSGNASGKLHVTYNENSTRSGLYVQRNSQNSAPAARFITRVNSSGSGYSLRNNITVDAAAANVYANYTAISSSSPTSHSSTGLYHGFSIQGNKPMTGLINFFANEGSGLKVGVNNYSSSTTTGPFRGVYNEIVGVGGGQNTKEGVYNSFRTASTGSHFGVRNNFESTQSGVRYGMFNNFSNGISSAKYGVYNTFGADVEGTLYGFYNTFSGANASTNTKYGMYTAIPNSAGGNHYGVYSDITKPGSFSGYFLGRVSIATDANTNYLLPADRGNLGEVIGMTAAGETDFIDLSSSFWSQDGNTITTTSRLGSNNAFPVIIRSNNLDRFRFEINGTLRSVGNGSENVPAYSFVNSTNSGMYLENNTDLTFTSSGNNFLRMREFPGSRQITFNPDGDPDMNLQIRGDTNVILNANPINENIQIGANANPNYASLSLAHDDKGFLPNRIQIANLSTFAPLPSSPLDGLIAYNSSSSTQQGLYIWEDYWKKLYSNRESLVPQTSGTFNIGSATNRYNTIFLVNTPDISSDKRLKNNIQNVTVGLEEVLKMRPVHYQLKSDTSKSKLTGFIAQEMKELVPNVVQTDKNGMLSMRYTELIPVLTKAIQEQQEVIDNQNQNIENLEERITRLEELIEKISKQ